MYWIASEGEFPSSQSLPPAGQREARRNDCIRRAMKMRQCGGLEGDGNTHNQDDQGGLSDGGVI